MVLTCVDCLHFKRSDGSCAKGWHIEVIAQGCGGGAALPLASPSGEEITASTCPEFQKKAAGKKP